MAQAAEEYGSHDKTFEIAAAGVGPRGRRRWRDAARARRSTPATSGGCARPRTPRSRIGCGWPWRARGRPARRPCSGSTRRAPTTPRCCARFAPALDELDTDGLADRDPRRGRGRPVHARARARRQGHDLGHRQRAARLPHRSVPDPRARHEREDAVDRAADAAAAACSRPAPADRRPGTSSSSSRRTICAGTRSGSSSRSAPSLELLAEQDDNPRAKLLADTLDRAIGRLLEENRSPSRRSASSTTAALTSTWRCTGPRSWPSRRRRRARRRFEPLAERLADRRGDDRRRAGRGTGLVGRDRRLLPPRYRQGGGGDAPERDPERGARLAVSGLSRWSAERLPGARRCARARTRARTADSAGPR